MPPPPPPAAGGAVGATGAAVGATGAAVGATGAAVGAAAGGDTTMITWGGCATTTGSGGWLAGGKKGKKVRGLPPSLLEGVEGDGDGVAQSDPHVRLVAMTGAHAVTGGVRGSKQAVPICKSVAAAVQLRPVVTGHSAVTAMMGHAKVFTRHGVGFGVGDGVGDGDGNADGDAVCAATGATATAAASSSDAATTESILVTMMIGGDGGWEGCKRPSHGARLDG